MHNYIFIDVVKSMMNFSCISDLIYGEFLKTIMYILNRIPSKSISSTIFKLWIDKNKCL